MKPKRLVILGLGLAVLVFAVGLFINLSQGNSPAGLAQGTSASPAAASKPPTSHTAPAPSAQPSSAAASKPAASKPAEGKPTATKPPSSSQGGPAASPDPAKPLEVQPPAPEATKMVLPTSKPNAALVSAPLPKLADASGELAAGYPGEGLPPVDGSKIVSSSVSPQDTILQTTLVANSGSDAPTIKSFYQTHFAPLGFGISEAPAAAGSTAAWFTRGADKITLTVTPVQGGSKYILYGVLHTAG